RYRLLLLRSLEERIVELDARSRRLAKAGRGQRVCFLLSLGDSVGNRRAGPKADIIIDPLTSGGWLLASRSVMINFFSQLSLNLIRRIIIFINSLSVLCLSIRDIIEILIFIVITNDRTRIRA